MENKKKYIRPEVKKLGSLKQLIMGGSGTGESGDTAGKFGGPKP